MKDPIAAYRLESESLDWRTPVRRATHAARRYWMLIAASCVVALMLLVAYERIFPPIYRAEVVLQGESPQDVVRSTYYANWNIFRKGDPKSEPELLTSSRVAHQVVLALDLKFDDVHHTFLTHATALWTDSWLGKKYRAAKEWFFPPDPGMFRPTQAQIDMARTVEAFVSGVTVDGVSGTYIAKVGVKAPSYRAGEFANKLVEVFLEERSRMFREEADAAYNALQAEVARAAAEIAELDRRKLEFDTKNKVVLDFEKDKLVVGQWATMQQSMMDVRANIASLEATRETIEQQLATEPKEIVSARTLQDSKPKTMLQQREFELASSLQASRERYLPGSPEITQLEAMLAQVRAQLQHEPDKVEIGQERVTNPAYNELRNRYNSVVTQLASAKALLAAKSAPMAKLQARLDEVPGLVKEVIGQSRARESMELRYKLLRERAMQAEVSRATVGLASSSIKVIDPATTPLKASWPRNIILVPATIAAGLLVGFAIALLLEIFSSLVNRDRLASRSDLPVYAVVQLPRAVQPALPGEPSAAVRRLRRPA